MLQVLAVQILGSKLHSVLSCLRFVECLVFGILLGVLQVVRVLKTLRFLFALEGFGSKSADSLTCGFPASSQQIVLRLRRSDVARMLEPVTVDRWRNHSFFLEFAEFA